MLDWEGSKDNKKTGNISISLVCVCVWGGGGGGGGGEEEGNEDRKFALFDPSTRIVVPFLIIQRALEVPFFIKLPCPFLFLG